jgi:hypothetical protein
MVIRNYVILSLGVLVGEVHRVTKVDQSFPDTLPPVVWFGVKLGCRSIVEVGGVERCKGASSFLILIWRLGIEIEGRGKDWII